jgi:hypothetical protein
MKKFVTKTIYENISKHYLYLGIYLRKAGTDIDDERVIVYEN